MCPIMDHLCQKKPLSSSELQHALAIEEVTYLYDYAAKNWGHDARVSSIEDVNQLILNLLEDEAKASACSNAVMVPGSYPGYSQRVPRQMTGLHLAVFVGLEESTTALLDKGADPGLKDTFGRTPLHCATLIGQEGVIKLLLNKDANLNLKGQLDGTALRMAVRNRHEAVVKLLLDKSDADLDTRDQYGRTPLRLAAMGKNEALVKLLLVRGVDLNSKYRVGQTPLHWAMLNGNEDVVELLAGTRQ
ncbi:ankyrin repeat domain-containing protein [Aspergillus tanneri]|uniref:Uncharacterized protein n=1 Tax=Aspergillus tanneri TaxID=1220188 RepID=A0A5M9MX60_9EURO|nr:uncharacterized protein ATNIH1004_002609 [Aspergillus tanneri]KAA8649930.1 hypothetical protein ATNIH1004_002609 [Aspergillus tanneri]